MDNADDRRSEFVCSAVRMGHAFRAPDGMSESAGLEMVLDILADRSPLEPREPLELATVTSAESILGLSVRVIYTFVGCLHPKLGTIGLIISPACLVGRHEGTTKCDSGGLAGRHGVFHYLPVGEVENALIALTFRGEGPDWLRSFAREIAQSYAAVGEYVRGKMPDYSMWNDARAGCLSAAAGDSNVDRRVWTWEVRLLGPPKADEFEALVVSPEVFKRLEHLQHTGAEVPSHVRVLHGRVGPTGVEYFSDSAVGDLLLGES
jgi:hypothetical protein